MKLTITLALMVGAMMTCLVACSDDQQNPTNPKGGAVAKTDDGCYEITYTVRPQK